MALLCHKWLCWSLNYPLGGLEPEIKRRMEWEGVLEGKAESGVHAALFKGRLRMTPQVGIQFDKQEKYTTEMVFLTLYVE